MFKITKITLASEGYELVECIADTDLAATIQSERPDLVLLDINMPGLNGYDTCKKLKENDKLIGQLKI